MIDAFRPIELLDTARALHGTESLADYRSARIIAGTAETEYSHLSRRFRDMASQCLAATFIIEPFEPNIVPAIAKQWVWVTVPTNDINRALASLRLHVSTAIFCFWLSLIEDIAAGQKSPEELLAKDNALGLLLGWEERHLARSLALPFRFSPQDESLPLDKFVRLQPIAA